MQYPSAEVLGAGQEQEALWERGCGGTPWAASLCQGMFEPYLKSFYIRSTDPTQIKILKVRHGPSGAVFLAHYPPPSPQAHSDTQGGHQGGPGLRAVGDPMEQVRWSSAF